MKSTEHFQRAADSRPPGILKEIWLLLRRNKKWWLLPVIVALLIMGALVMLGGTSLAPWIYTLF